MIGIISDTHDNVDNVIKAVKIFKERNVDIVIHAGDIVAPPTAMQFEGLKTIFIKGNNDGQVSGLRSKIGEIGCSFYEDIAEIEHDGKKIAVTHYPDKARELAKTGKYDFVVYGHDHRKNDENISNTKIINPGAHHWKSEGTIAFLDEKTGSVEFLRL